MRLSVSDTAGTCSYGYRERDQLCAASTIKLLVLAVTLEEPQRLGALPEGELLGQLTRMIQWSDNEATTWVLDQYESAGAAFPAAGLTWGFDDARHPRWGTSLVTAAQMVALVTQMFLSERLTPQARALAFELLDLPAQNWDEGWRVGVGYGAPTDWYHGSKIGLLSCGNGLALHGVGLLCGPGRSPCWSIALLSDGWATEQQGFDGLNRIGGILTSTLVSHIKSVTADGGDQ